MWPPFFVMGDPPHTVFDHDHRTVDDQPEVDRSETHETGCDPGHGHHIRREQHRERDCQRHDNPGPQASQHHQQDNNDQRSPFQQIFFDRMQGAIDEIRTIIGHFRRDPFGKCLVDFRQPLFGGEHNGA